MTEIPGLGDSALEDDPAAGILKDHRNGDGEKDDSQKRGRPPLRQQSEFPGGPLEQHDHKEEEDHDRPCVDDEDEGSQQGRPEQEEEGCCAQEGDDQVEHGMNRLPPGYGETRCRQDDDGKQIKDGRI